MFSSSFNPKNDGMARFSSFLKDEELEKNEFVLVSKLGSLHTFGESCLISHVW